MYGEKKSNQYSDSWANRAFTGWRLKKISDVFCSFGICLISLDQFNLEVKT